MNQHLLFSFPPGEMKKKIDVVPLGLSDLFLSGRGTNEREVVKEKENRTLVAHALARSILPFSFTISFVPKFFYVTFVF